MKNIILLCCFSMSFPVVADIVPPPANYSIATDDTVTDATGQVNDDPEQVVSLTATEISTVKTSINQVGGKVEEDWQIRQDAAAMNGN